MSTVTAAAAAATEIRALAGAFRRSATAVAGARASASPRLVVTLQAGESVFWPTTAEIHRLVHEQLAASLRGRIEEGFRMAGERIRARVVETSIVVNQQPQIGVRTWR